MIQPLRDEDGRRIPDDYEVAAMQQAADRDQAARGLLTPAAFLTQLTTGLRPNPVVDHDAVNEEIRSRQARGLPIGGATRQQLEFLHTHTPGPVLDLTDKGAAKEWEDRLQREIALRTMAPGSGVAKYAGNGQWVGDPDVIQRVQAGETAKRAQLAQEHFAQQAPGLAHYNVLDSVR